MDIKVDFNVSGVENYNDFEEKFIQLLEENGWLGGGGLTPTDEEGNPIDIDVDGLPTNKKD